MWVRIADVSWTQEELAHADLFLRREMGLDIKQTSQAQLNFTKDEINQYVKRFKSLDMQDKGFITINDLRSYFKVSTWNSGIEACQNT